MSRASLWRRVFAFVLAAASFALAYLFVDRDYDSASGWTFAIVGLIGAVVATLGDRRSHHANPRDDRDLADPLSAADR